MRLAAQTKLGFYPAHADAVEAICKLLAPHPDRGSMMTMIDPCAGEGLAAAQIAAHLGVPLTRVYLIEMDAGRAAKCRENVPGAKVLGPASFLGVKVTAGSMSLAYVNPPFDDEIGGGRRVEFSFAQDATALLKPGGVLVLVLPYRTIQNGKPFRDFLDSYYDRAQIFKFPEHVRPFKEVVYVGVRRDREVSTTSFGYGGGYLAKCELHYHEPWQVIGERGQTVTVPWAHAPGIFRKIDLTEDELVAALDESPLLDLLKPPPLLAVKQPPADLSVGHVSLVLAAGLLNGIIRPDDEPPHVVRGTARKVDFQSQPPTETESAQEGVRTIKEIISQKIELVVRAVGQDGEIMTYSEKKKGSTDGASVDVDGTVIQEDAK